MRSASRRWSRSRLMIGCTASPTRTTLAARVLRDKSPPKRPKRAAWRYSGSASWYLLVMTQARADSVSSPLEMMRAGAGASLIDWSQQGQACDPLVLNHPQLLGNDVQLLAGLDPDLHQGRPVMGAAALGLGQLMADDFTRQRRVEGAAPPLGAPMAGDGDTLGRLILLRGDAVRARRQGFGLVEKQIGLVVAAGLTLGREELA